MRWLVALTVALVLAPGAATAQTALFEVCGDSNPLTGASFGSILGGVGDFDGDGVPDAMVSEIYSFNPASSAGHVISGTDGSTLATVRAMPAHATVLGDVDGDGVPELLVSTHFPYQVLEVVSGADVSKVLLKLGGPSGIPFFSGTLGDFDATGDLSGDGVPDFIVGQSTFQATFTQQGAVQLVSGMDGSVVHTWLGDSAFALIGLSVAALGDVNADGVEDIAYSGGYAVAYVVSGTDGSPLLTIAEPDPAYFDTCVAAPGDVDGDGRADVAVGMRHGLSSVPVSTAVTRMHSGATGALLWEGQGASELLTVLGDVDGDGIAEVAARGQHHVPATGENPRHIRVFSGADGMLLYHLQGEGYDAGAYATTMAGVGDLDGDGRGDLAFSSSPVESCARFLSLRAPTLSSMSPDALPASDFQGTFVTLEVEDASYVQTVHVAELLVPAVATGPTTVKATLPAPPTVGSVPVRVSNIGQLPSEALTMAVLETQPPVVEVATVALTIEPVVWALWGGVGDAGWLLASLGSSTLAIQGWPVLSPATVLAQVTLDTAGSGSVSLSLPPAAAGLFITAQLVTIDGATSALNGTSSLVTSVVAF